MCTGCQRSSDERSISARLSWDRSLFCSPRSALTASLRVVLYVQELRLQLGAAAAASAPLVTTAVCASRQDLGAAINSSRSRGSDDKAHPRPCAPNTFV